MNKFISVVEKYLVPVASKFAGQKHLMSIKDAFIAMLPLTLTGSFAVLFSVLLRDIPTAFNGGEVTAFTETMEPVLNIMGNISAGTLSLMALVFAFSYAYNLAQHSNVDALPAGIIGIAIFMVTVPTKIMVEGVSDPITALSFDYLGAGGLFTSIIFITVFVAIYCKLAKSKVTIKMPDTVPPAVAKAFAAVIPGVIAVFGSAIVAHIVFSFAGMPVSDLIAKIIQTPLMQLSQGLPAVIIVTLVTQILWFFGLHGMLVLG
ncbi:MAG: PTS transporter subunit EIIC, partial [Mycoplasmatales bacterium]